jgi:hypothetical protein
MPGYDDGRVACTDQEIVIRHYYLMGPKRIRYDQIRKVLEVPLGTAGRWRIHGSGDFVHWFNFDPGRPHKTVALVLYLLDARIRPVITPDDPQQVAEEFAAHGVNIARGTETGLR